MNILKLIRWKNLIMIAAVQLLVKFALFQVVFADGSHVSTTLNTLGLTVLILATVCIAAGGYIINDIYDMETDAVNKPEKVIVGKHLSEKTANYLYMAFTVIGVGLGFYLSHSVGKPPFFAIFVIISALLYIYASYLKQIAIVGNILVSVVVALSIIIVGVFELLPVMTEQNQHTQSVMLEILLDFAIFSFFINFIREIVKDIQDVDGDHKAGMQTLPILFGKTRSAKVAFAITVITISIVAYYTITYLYTRTLAAIYFLIVIIGPLIYVAIKLFTADKNIHFKHISLMLKIVMITGMIAMIIYKFTFNDVQ